MKTRDLVKGDEFKLTDLDEHQHPEFLILKGENTVLIRWQIVVIECEIAEHNECETVEQDKLMVVGRYVEEFWRMSQ